MVVEFPDKVELNVQFEEIGTIPTHQNQPEAALKHFLTKWPDIDLRYLPISIGSILKLLLCRSIGGSSKNQNQNGFREINTL
jgi:hypothetical protein